MSRPTLANLATRIFNTPLLIHPDKLDVIFSILGPRLGLSGEISDSAPESFSLQAPQRAMGKLKAGGVRAGSANGGGRATIAVIPVFGTLVHRSMGLSAYSGLRSYESIRADFRAAMNDQEADAVAFEFASPGGEGHGLFDLVDEIYAARAENGKRITAIVNEYAFSAAYALASACHDIYLTRTSAAGSIGVISRHLDRSKANEMDGLSYTTIFAGDRKNDFSPDGPVTDEAMEVWRKSIVQSYDLFVATVARNRGIKEQAVRDTQASVYIGMDAVQAGLADKVLSYNKAIEMIAANIKPTGGRFMSGQQTGLQHQLEALFKGSSKDEINAALSPIGYVPGDGMLTEGEKEQFGADRHADGMRDGRREGLDYCREVIALCGLAGQPLEMAKTIIDKDMSIDDARKHLVDARAQEQGGLRRITSTVGPTGSGQVSSLVANAQSRADKK